MPTLWIHGMEDPFVPAARLALLPDSIPNVRIQRFENCGHWVPEEQPAKLSQSILEFLGDLKNL